MKAHIFVDNSNLWLGASDIRQEREAHVPQRLFRLYFKNLFKLVERDLEVVTRELGGSLPPECEPLWEYARELGYNTNLLHRVHDGDRVREQSVDEALHLKIANCIIDFDAPGRFVLMTGDGAQSELNTSFRDQARRALKSGFEVDVWSWAASRSRKYELLKQDFPDKIRIHDLDNYYNEITFVNQGTWTHSDGTSVDIAGRVVCQLSSSIGV